MAETALPPKYTMTIWRDATFHRVIKWYTGPTDTSPLVDLSGYSATLSVRSPGSTTDIFTLTSSTGGITLGGLAGTISIVISAATTKTLTWNHGNYELLLDSGAEVKTLFRGIIRVKGL